MAFESVSKLGVTVYLFRVQIAVPIWTFVYLELSVVMLFSDPCIERGNGQRPQLTHARDIHKEDAPRFVLALTKS